MQLPYCLLPHSFTLVGWKGLEPSTSRLSAECSNQLSYQPLLPFLLMVEVRRIELLTSCVQGRRSPSWAISPCHRLFITLFTFITHSVWVVGLSGLEPPTSPLSGVRSNHLSYRPKGITAFCSILSTIYQSICVDTYCLSFLVRRWSSRTFRYGYLVTTSPQSWIIPW